MFFTLSLTVVIFHSLPPLSDVHFSSSVFCSFLQFPSLLFRLILSLLFTSIHCCFFFAVLPIILSFCIVSCSSYLFAFHYPFLIRSFFTLVCYFIICVIVWHTDIILFHFWYHYSFQTDSKKDKLRMKASPIRSNKCKGQRSDSLYIFTFLLENISWVLVIIHVYVVGYILGIRSVLR
jgi:hypothetical protein